MALLTTINNIPLYSTISEAITWGNSISLEGYHIHEYNGVTGYMSGENHQNAILAQQTSIEINDSSLLFEENTFFDDNNLATSVDEASGSINNIQQPQSDSIETPIQTQY